MISSTKITFSKFQFFKSTDLFIKSPNDLCHIIIIFDDYFIIKFVCNKFRFNFVTYMPEEIVFSKVAIFKKNCSIITS